MTSSRADGAVAPAWLSDTPLAHRGLHGAGVPENSLAAFVAARDAGYGVELDVWVTRDRVPVVAHDPVLTAITGASDRIGEVTLEQLRRHPLLGSHEVVPTLAESLAVLAETPTMVEVKSLRLTAGRAEEAIAGVLDDHHGPVCVASFNPAVGRWLRRHRPSVPRVLTSGPASSFGRLPGPVRARLAALRDLDGVAPAAVSYDLRGLPNEVTDRWREAGGVLVTWTVADDDALVRARRLADNVIFEHLRP